MSAMSPNEELARRVAEALAAARVIPPDDCDVIARRLAEGALRQADWELLVGDAPADLPRP